VECTETNGHPQPWAVSRPGGEYMGLFCPHLEDVDAVEGRQRQSDHLGWELLSRLYPHLDVMTFSEWRSRSDRLIGRNHFLGRFASNAADESVRDAGAKATVTGLQHWTAEPAGGIFRAQSLVGARGQSGGNLEGASR
jgi:hypothetical protein